MKRRVVSPSLISTFPANCKQNKTVFCSQIISRRHSILLETNSIEDYQVTKEPKILHLWNKFEGKIIDRQSDSIEPIV